VKIPKEMDMTEAKLTELFKVCGEVTSVILSDAPTHAFGFVEFATVPEAEAGIEKVNGNQGMLVKFARPQAHEAPVVAATSALPTVEEPEAEESGDECDSQVPKKDKTFDDDCVAAAAKRYPNPVESLQARVQKAISTSFTAGCIAYTVAEVEDEWETLFVGTVELKLPAGNMSHSGKPQGNKKEAKKAAAEAALRAVDLHRLLSALPTKVKEQKVAKAADSEVEDDENHSTAEVDEEVDESREQEQQQKGRTVLSSKQQKQLEKAELRAKRQAKKRAKREAAKQQQEQEDEEEEEEDEEEDEEDSTVASEEESSEENSEESDEEESSEAGETDEAETAEKAALAAKKAAIKAALAAKRSKRGGHTVISSEKDKDKVATSASTGSAQNRLMKIARRDLKMADEAQKSSKQQNYGQTKFIKP